MRKTGQTILLKGNFIVIFQWGGGGGPDPWPPPPPPPLGIDPCNIWLSDHHENIKDMVSVQIEGVWTGPVTFVQ